ncbi:MAG TPA: nuclear transport factor 2 family protein [Solirubrobacterales bacterium]|nr:nuclear transport factor 2 family protein [Solirubrobacterales bacterium]
MTSADERVETIERLYGGFGGGDPDAMAACYHPDVHFSDPVFPDLNGPEVMKMWRTLLSRSDDLELTLGEREADGDTGSAHWTARYTFSGTGRRVVNEIDARFLFQDGLIIDHRDSFDFWKWSRMALGAPGLLLGWSPMLKKKVRAQSAQLIASPN